MNTTAPAPSTPLPRYAHLVATTETSSFRFDQGGPEAEAETIWSDLPEADRRELVRGGTLLLPVDGTIVRWSLVRP